LSYRGPALSDLELRYPFAPRSRRFFESIPVEEGLTSREVVQQTESRLLSALGRRSYEPHLSELIEFSSFFAAALVASQDGYLTMKFAKKEAERSKAFFMKEGAKTKVVVVAECFNAPMTLLDGGDQTARYSVQFEDYLMMVAHYDLSKQPRWKLARQALQRGVVFVSDNLLNDLFCDCAEKAISDGVKNLRKAPFPKQLLDLKASLARYIPVQKSGTGRGYLYVEHLLKNPVADGRHRLVWLVLAPYLVNVKKLADDEAIDTIRAFVSVAGETRDMRRFVEYNVRRARRNGLLPPTFSTLKNEHPDLYSLLPKEALATDVVQKPKSSRA
jgi:hypothetical protein